MSEQEPMTPAEAIGTIQAIRSAYGRDGSPQALWETQALQMGAEALAEAQELGISYTAEIERLRGLLKRLEWAGGSGCEYAACPGCGDLKTQAGGHAPDCELAAALREGQKGT
jgi:hypothetical protein